MTVLWTTEELPGLAFDPEPPPDDEDDDGPYCGTVTTLRAAEIHDQRGQGVGPAALWTAQTVPTGSYL